MKVLLVHNFYKSSYPSGEDIVFKNEEGLLKNNNIEVITYTKHNDEIKDYELADKVFLSFRNVWSKRTYKEIKEIIRKEKPDIAHFHNIWYLISPSAYYACKDAGVPVVQTLHNFRIFCANGLMLRKNKICEKCLSVLPWRAIFYGCYRDSRLYSVPVALSELVHKVIGTWKEAVDIYIAVTKFSQEKFVEAGLPKNKVIVKPNFLINPPNPSFVYRDYILFVGRLSSEKGVETLIEAFKILLFNISKELTLKIIGEGPLKEHLEKKIKSENIKNVEFLGMLNHSETIEVLKNAKFLVLPSIWYEMFPMVILEAFACGKSVIASNLGALVDIISDGRTGLLFEPGNSEELASKIRWLMENENILLEMGKNARTEFEEKYTPEKNFKLLMNIYTQILSKMD